MKACVPALLGIGTAALAATLLLAATALAATTVTVSPLPGTRDASAKTQISFLGAPVAEIKDVSVVGSRSGRHTGRLAGYASRPGASFLPTHPFVEGEDVSASALVGSGSSARRVGTSFTVALHDYGYRFSAQSAGASAIAAASQSFYSEPSIKPARVSVTADPPGAAPGDIFLTFNHGQAERGPMILDEAGRLVWFEPAPKGEVAMDLQAQQYQGKPVLTWWQGYIASLGVGFGTVQVYDSSYRRVAEIRAGNGYWADLHEALLTPQGSAFVTAYSLVHADLASVGGSRDGVLLDAILQEVDVRTGLVMFEWHAWGHVALSNSFSHPYSASLPWDWFHLNSISLGPDGNILISARNTWAAYDISSASGRVLWRLGGKHPSFEMGAGTGMAWQHDVRWQPDHTITAFDDGAVPKVHSESRAIRERIDWAHRSVSLVARYVHTPALTSGSQGNYQLLPNGDSFVGWGAEPYFTEFSPSGQVVFDAHVPAPGQSYRAYRFPWRGTPASPPRVAVRSSGAKGSSGAAEYTVYASWNGATEVRQWRVLAGAGSGTLTPVAAAPKNGFETAIPVKTSAARIAVQALDATGAVIDGSPVVAVPRG